MTEYAWRSLIGTLTPQANTTVEPEFGILFPPGIATVNARMVSGAPAMRDRLIDYYEQLAGTTAQFANAPLNAMAVACTGASYLVGRAREAAIVQEIEAARGVPLVTSGLAVVQALQVLGARRIGFISPYDRALTDASVTYWQSFGLEVAAMVEVGAIGGAFHPIYAMPAADAAGALKQIGGKEPLDAVVMLGTGMPTLGPILAQPRVNGAPVLSCMLATAWRATLAAARQAPHRDNLLPWIDQPEWAARFSARQPPAALRATS